MRWWGIERKARGSIPEAGERSDTHDMLGVREDSVLDELVDLIEAAVAHQSVDNDAVDEVLERGNSSNVTEARAIKDANQDTNRRHHCVPASTQHLTVDFQNI